MYASSGAPDPSGSREIPVCGLHAVEALFAARPNAVKRFFLTAERLPRFKKACKHLADLKKLYKVCGEDEIYAVCKTRHHQGLAALIAEMPVKPLLQTTLENWAKSGECGLFLVDIGNDHNLGAILRSAAFFGWKYVVVTGNNVKLTTAAYRVAEGGAEHVELFSVKCPEEAADFIKKASSMMNVFGACVEKGESAFSVQTEGACMLVLGNEETGLPDIVKQACTRLIRIKGAAAIESLNVSAAAAVLMYALSK